MALLGLPLLLLAVPFGIGAALVLALAYYLKLLFGVAGLLIGALGLRRGIG